MRRCSFPMCERRHYAHGFCNMHWSRWRRHGSPDVVRRGFWKHGDTNSKEHRIWRGIKERCLNPRNPAFHHYGGRGITLCQQWADSYVAFLTDVGRAPNLTDSIDRIDVNGPYAPGNVRWATRREQANNRRINRWVVIDKSRFTLAEVCRLYGLSRAQVTWRLAKPNFAFTLEF